MATFDDLARRIAAQRDVGSGAFFRFSVSVDPRQVSRILSSETGHNTIFDLALNGGEQTKAMIVDWQYEPVKGKLLHIDLKRELPEIMKPRTIPITKGQTNVRSIEGDAQRVRESQAA